MERCLFLFFTAQYTSVEANDRMSMSGKAPGIALAMGEVTDETESSWTESVDVNWPRGLLALKTMVEVMKDRSQIRAMLA